MHNECVFNVRKRSSLSCVIRYCVRGLTFLRKLEQPAVNEPGEGRGADEGGGRGEGRRKSEEAPRNLIGVYAWMSPAK